MKNIIQLRKEFERRIEGLPVVKYSLQRNSDGEYRSPAVFHMWTGYCLSAIDNKLIEPDCLLEINK